MSVDSYVVSFLESLSPLSSRRVAFISFLIRSSVSAVFKV